MYMVGWVRILGTFVTGEVQLDQFPLKSSRAYALLRRAWRVVFAAEHIILAQCLLVLLVVHQ
jgi:hypothetical protein